MKIQLVKLHNKKKKKIKTKMLGVSWTFEKKSKQQMKVLQLDT